MDKTYLLIGGSNVDYIATSRDKLQRRVSNIGEISISFGGVMRNIAENLARLGNNIDFITAIGDDANGREMRKELVELGINVITPVTEYPSGSYLAINDSNHDMVDAVCDNRIIRDLNVEFLKKHDELIKSHEYVIMDANVSNETIDYLFKTYPTKKFIVEAISPSKVLKFKEKEKCIMTKETMSVHKALSELKIMESRITNAIGTGIYCIENKHSNEKIKGVLIDDYKKVMHGNYDKATDLIKRYNAIKKAVVLSNAKTTVMIGEKEYTVAEAIYMNNHGVQFDELLL